MIPQQVSDTIFHLCMRKYNSLNLCITLLLPNFATGTIKKIKRYYIRRDFLVTHPMEETIKWKRERGGTDIQTERGGGRKKFKFIKIKRRYDLTRKILEGPEKHGVTDHEKSCQQAEQLIDNECLNSKVIYFCKTFYRFQYGGAQTRLQNRVEGKTLLDTEQTPCLRSCPRGNVAKRTDKTASEITTPKHLHLQWLEIFKNRFAFNVHYSYLFHYLHIIWTENDLMRLTVFQISGFDESPGLLNTRQHTLKSGFWYRNVILD